MGTHRQWLPRAQPKPTTRPPIWLASPHASPNYSSCCLAGCFLSGRMHEPFAHGHRPVSYTHLTLPTICSV
eukprot:4765192-Alexandrium_andersonii.AAC.1